MQKKGKFGRNTRHTVLKRGSVANTFSLVKPNKNMKKNLVLPLFLAVAMSASAQPDPDALKVQGGGSMGKKTIVPKLDKLAVAQSTIIFKTATTREMLKNEKGAFGGRKSLGGSVTGRVTAYLETTDGDLTKEDFQGLADHFYTYLNQQLEAAGIATVDWGTVTKADFYTAENESGDEKKVKEETQRKGQVYEVVNANNGNTLISYDPTKTMNIGFAFGKMKRAGKFSDDLDAPVAYMHTVVDFADIMMDGDAKTGTSVSYEAGGITKITKTKAFNFNSSVGANLKVAGGATWDGKPVGGRIMFYNQKMATDMIQFEKDISSGVKFANEVTQDPNRKVLNKKENIFAKDFNAVPVVISTTKAQYIAAAKTALENYAVSLATTLKEE